MDGEATVQSEKCGAIYQKIAEACPPAILPPVFDRLPVASQARSGHPEPLCLQALLEKDFSQKELLAANALTRAADGSAMLNPHLALPSATFIILRKSEGALALPFDIIGEQGCLSGSLPIIAALDDWEIQARLSRRTLFVTFSVVDMVALLSMGFAAATAAGLSQLGGVELVKVYRRLAWEKVNYERPPGHVRYESHHGGPIPSLVVTGWPVAKFELVEPAGLALMRDHFDGLYRTLKIDVSGVNVWTPAADELQHIKYSLKFGGLSDVKQWALSSVKHSKSIVSLDVDHLRPKSYHEAISKLQTAVRQGNDGISLPKALKAAQDAVEEHLIRPMLADAEKIPNVIRKNLLVMAADEFRKYHAHSIQSQSEHYRALHSEPKGRATPETFESSVRQVAILNKVLALIRELHRGK